jgi:hypothetical protein
LATVNLVQFWLKNRGRPLQNASSLSSDLPQVGVRQQEAGATAETLRDMPDIRAVPGGMAAEPVRVVAKIRRLLEGGRPRRSAAVAPV